MSGLLDQQMGGGRQEESNRDLNGSNRVPTVDQVEPVHSVDSVDSVDSGVEPPELLPTHEIASEIANREDSEEEPVGEESGEDCDPSQVTTSPHTMIDATDFRGVLSAEPTYQTLNGRMTPPGFATSSNYATLTPLQPLPPISTMSDKFSHHYGHNPGNGGFALMQNATLGMTNMTTYHSQYDKLGTAMAAAGMSMSVSSSLGVISSGSHTQQAANAANAAAAAAAMMTSSNGLSSHANVISSSPYTSNSLNSPDKSLSPSNGYNYSHNQRGLGSPQSPSSVNLHSPTSLMPALNGLPSTPPLVQISPSPSPRATISSQHITLTGIPVTSIAPNHHQNHHGTTSASHEVKLETTLTAPQPVTVLQAAVTPTPAAIAPTSHSVTIVQTASATVVSILFRYSNDITNNNNTKFQYC